MPNVNIHVHNDTREKGADHIQARPKPIPVKATVDPWETIDLAPLENGPRREVS